jgi:OOP family OmpA-OmpF porin
MRLSALTVAIAAFLIAAILSVVTARVVVATVEDRSVDAVQEALMGQGHTWASVQGDGLQIVIEGQAPSEASRFRAMSSAGSVVDASRVIDNMSIVASQGITPPDFAVEILRNDSGISLIGLIPEATDREALNARIAAIAGAQPVSDFLEAANYPRPDLWRESMTLALRALEVLPQSKISVRAGRVEVTAIAVSADEKRRLEAELTRAAPPGVRLALTITAPRPVITPFIVRFAIDDRGPHFDACAADTEEARQVILAAAVAAGASGRMSCTVGLGSPTREWSNGVAKGIGALAELGGGTITFTDADVLLVAEQGADPALFDRVVGELTNSLPDVFVLNAELPETPEAQPSGPPQFTATLDEDGAVRLRGRVPDDLINTTAREFAVARFGLDNVTMATRVTDGLPQGWALRILASLEALSDLSEGSVVVEPDQVTIRGTTGSQEASNAISALMIEKLGPDARVNIDVTYDEALDPVLGLPTPEECIARIGVVTDDRKILFDPGSASLTAASQQVVDDIAEVLRQCLDLPIEIAGYTDSQGRDEMNLSLSQDRADAVLAALRARRVPVGTFVSVGYGEIDPIADNDSAEGREANRRIEFRLIPGETEEDGDAAPEDAAGATGDEAAEDAAAEE